MHMQSLVAELQLPQPQSFGGHLSEAPGFEGVGFSASGLGPNLKSCEGRFSDGHRAWCLLLVAEGGDEDPDEFHAGDLGAPIANSKGPRLWQRLFPRVRGLRQPFKALWVV